MGQLIRTFFQKRRERKYWRTRLEPLIDRMMEERESANGERIDLQELGTRVDEVTERPVRSGEGSPMRSAAGQAEDEIDLDGDPVSMEGGSGATMSPDQASQATAAAAPQEEDGRAEQEGKREAEGGQDPFFPCKPVSLEDLLDELMDRQNITTLAASGTSEAMTDAGEAIALPASKLEDLQDDEVDLLKKDLRLLVRQHAAGGLLQIAPTRAPRRKHVDARATVKRMTRTGGAFNGFAYRPSPSEQPTRVDAHHLLVIADVSGSMGRYVGIVLYLLACLEELATVDSYVFSDSATYASDLLGSGDFREQFTRLKEGAASWEYGTRLSQALRDVNQQGRFHAGTRVLLLTDGGFSLIGEDWPDTVRGLLALHEAVDSLHLITTNPQLLADGPACAEALWNVERDPRAGHELLPPDTQKTARYGLLTRYSSSAALCQTPDDLLQILRTLLV